MNDRISGYGLNKVRTIGVSIVPLPVSLVGFSTLFSMAFSNGAPVQTFIG